MYVDRWEIEVNHRDEKDLVGAGQAQERAPQSNARNILTCCVNWG